MRVLAIDVGSSSVKAAVLRDASMPRVVARESYPTRHENNRSEVDPAVLLRAISRAVTQLPQRDGLDAIALSVMSPAWVAMDARGRPLTPIVTHQDRRGIEESRRLLDAFGEKRILQLSGNLPFPGGISSTTCAWFVRHHRALMRSASLVGHLNTFLAMQFTGARIVDPSNAPFMGMYHTSTLGGWCDELIDAVGVKRSQLPEVRDSNRIAGCLNARGARILGIKHGTPVLTGMVDTSAAMLLAGATPGRMLDVCGTTDVLGLCVDRPKPHPKLLTRGLGIGRLWIHASTLASVGSTLQWAHDVLFSEMSDAAFRAMVRRIATDTTASQVLFEPYLAGDRMSVSQRRGSLDNLALDTTREEILASIIRALSASSASRIALFQKIRAIHPRVVVSGGAGKLLAGIMHRDWPGKWDFIVEDEATLRGLYKLAELTAD